MIRPAVLLALSLVLAGAVPAVDAPGGAETLRLENAKLAAENIVLQLRIEELMTVKEECLETIGMLRNHGAGERD